MSLAAGIWTPWLGNLPGYQAHLVELPGHGLSGPLSYQADTVRGQALALMDDLFDVLGLTAAPVVAHSIGGAFALWHAAARPGRIASLVVIGEPAVALPGVVVRMPLSLLTVPVLGEALLRSPMPQSAYRTLLGQGLSPAAAAAAPGELIDVLRYAARRPGNARTVASLMHAIDHFRRPRPAGIMTEDELRQISAPAMFCLGSSDPFLAPAQARLAVASIPAAAFHEVPGGHAPWLEDPVGSARLVTSHLKDTGFRPARSAPVPAGPQ